MSEKISRVDINLINLKKGKMTGEFSDEKES